MLKYGYMFEFPIAELLCLANYAMFRYDSRLSVISLSCLERNV